MALAPILSLVKTRLPWLTDGDDDAIQQVLEMQYVMLQPFTGKPDAEVDQESNYTALQRLLLKELTAYELLVTKAAASVGGVRGAKPATRVLKKTKADVVEAEFESVKLSDGTIIGLRTDDLLAQILKAACGYARQLDYPLALCGQGVGPAPPAFISVQDVGYLPPGLDYGYGPPAFPPYPYNDEQLQWLGT